MKEFNSRNPGYPDLDVAMSYSALLGVSSLVLFAKRLNQETEWLDLVNP